MGGVSKGVRRLLFAWGVWAWAATVTAAAPEPESHFLDVQGVRLHYLTAGAGPPVLLIHGLHASAELNWKLPGVMQELAQDHRVIAVDLPGHGRSDKPERADAHGRQLVADIVQLLDHLDVPRAHIVGYSLGGMVALKLLADHPDRCLSGTIGGMGWLREGGVMQRVWERLPARDGSRTPAAFVQSVGELAVSAESLERIRTPVKVLVGERDPVRRLYVTPLQLARPDWPVVEIGNAGHLDCILKPPFRAELAGWLREPARAAPPRLP